jgi:hypothetical protein
MMERLHLETVRLPPTSISFLMPFYSSGERIMFNYLLSQKFVGDIVNVTVLRDSKVHLFVTYSHFLSHKNR